MSPHALTLILAASTLLLGGCKSRTGADPFHQVAGSIFGTHYRVTYQGKLLPEQVQAVIRRELERIDWIASTWKPESELMRYNRATDKQAFDLSPELAFLLRRSEEIRQWTGGAFDIGFAGGQLDLSGIAKGYAVDRISELLGEQFGITSSLVDIGGEIKVCGPGPKGDSWRVGIYAPSTGGQPAPKTPALLLRDTSIATSGTTFRGHHLIDPASGEPANPPLLCVSVIHPSNTTADALATALFVMGPEKGIEWAEQHQVRVLYLMLDGTLREHRPSHAASR